MDVDSKDEDKGGKDKEKEKEKQGEEAAPPEPEFEVLQNPARVTTRQLQFISFDVDDRYSPIKNKGVYGIVMLYNRHPDQEEVFVTPNAPPSEVEEDEGDEPEPPQPFEFDPEKEKD